MWKVASIILNSRWRYKQKYRRILQQKPQIWEVGNSMHHQVFCKKFMPISTNAFPFINLGFIGCRSWARPLTRHWKSLPPNKFMSLWEFIIYQNKQISIMVTKRAQQRNDKGSWQWEHRAKGGFPRVDNLLQSLLYCLA